MTRQLRDYQATAVADHDTRVAEGKLTNVGQAATGLGKSTILGETIVNHVRATRDPRALVLCHRNELVGQLKATLTELAPDIPVGVVAGAQHQADYPITVAMTPTLGGARGQRRRDHLAGFGMPTMIGYDEFHHAPARGNLAILDWAGAGGPGEHAQREPRIPLHGVTATLGRSDRYGLGDVMTEDDIVYDLGISWGVDNGWLVRPRGRVVVGERLDLTGVGKSKGDYSEKRLGELIAQSAESIVDAWTEHGEDRTTVAFVPSIEAGAELVHAFGARGVTAEIVTGATTAAERGDVYAGTGIYGRLATGATRVMVGLMVPTEGWDCPPASCVIMARPTLLWTLYAQMVGRVLRPVDAAMAARLGWRVPAGGKVDALVLDVVGTSRTQKLVTSPDIYPTIVYDRSALGPAEPGTGGAAPQRGPRQLVGPAIYEDVDLLLSGDTKGAWLATLGGHPFVTVGDRIAVIMAEQEGAAATSYRVVTMARRGRYDALVLGQRLSLSQAQETAQRWGIERRPFLAAQGASWRTNSARPSPRLVRTAERLGIADADTYSGRELSELVDIAEVSERVDPFGPGAARRAS
jgi:superfamily II DNA or RNA helicase